MKDLSRNVKLYCPTCGGQSFAVVDEIDCELKNAPDTTKIKCVNCNTEFTKAEIIEGNQNIINANIDMVISQISAMDFPFHTVIMSIYGANSEMARYILSIVSADNDFFDRTYIRILNSDIRPEVITNIRFKLQELAKINDQMGESTSEE